jgi:threonine synthase
MIACENCQLPYPEDAMPYCCPVCGGVFSLRSIDIKASDLKSLKLESGNFQAGFQLPDSAELVTLGEGSTPLLWNPVRGRKIGFKLESLNPTGSFKDRGTAVLVSRAKALGLKNLVEDSSGNAGSSLAAYSARAGIRARIYIPADASGPKRQQIVRMGAEMVPIPGPRANAAAAVLEAARSGAVYASHAYLPLGIPGIAAIAYELWHQLPGQPGAVLVPVGHGSLLLGVYHGFKALQNAGLINKLPVLIGVQSAECDPLVQAFEAGIKQAAPVKPGATLADGVRISEPIHDREILEAVQEAGGKLVRVGEAQLSRAWKELNNLGMDVEPTSALVWNALQNLLDLLPEPIICIISGHGLKSGSKFDYLT